MMSFKGFSKGVPRFSKGFSKGVVHFSKGVARFSKGVARFSSGCVKASRGCVTACSKESNSETQKEERRFMHVTLNLKDETGLYELDKVVYASEGVISCVSNNEKAHVSGYMHPKFIRRMKKLRPKVKIEDIQFGECSNHLYKKKEAPPKTEAPQKKEEAPSTKNAGPTTNNANTAIGYYQPQGYGGYYGNGGNDYFGYYGNGGYNGNIYNYQPGPAVYQKRIGYDHIDCAGDASECSGDHIGKAVTQDKSSKNTVEKSADSSKRN